MILSWLKPRSVELYIPSFDNFHTLHRISHFDMEHIMMRARTPRTSLEDSPTSTITNAEWADREIDSILPTPSSSSPAYTTRSDSSSMDDLNGPTACGTPQYMAEKGQSLVGITEKLGKLVCSSRCEVESYMMLTISTACSGDQRSHKRQRSTTSSRDCPSRRPGPLANVEKTSE